jgi:hypothetical protein
VFAEWVGSHFQFCRPALFSIGFEQCIHNPTPRPLGIIAVIRRVANIMLGIICRADMTIRQTKQSKKDLWRESRIR